MLGRVRELWVYSQKKRYEAAPQFKKIWEGFFFKWGGKQVFLKNYAFLLL